MKVEKNMKILVADDMQSMRNSIKSTLKQIGFKDITEAVDGIQALAYLKNRKYDLLITDWNMPNMDGITLLRMIRRDAEMKNLIVLMVTAEADKEHVIEAIKLGINDYIVKPFTADVLQKKMGKIIEKLQSGR
jgi:two-component system, chemotaxis family, chemotaxis protein CheY